MPPGQQASTQHLHSFHRQQQAKLEATDALTWTLTIPTMAVLHRTSKVQQEDKQVLQGLQDNTRTTEDRKEGENKQAT